MRDISFTLALALFAAATSLPLSAAQITERMRLLTVVEGEFLCRGPTGNPTYPKCTDVPVLALLKRDTHGTVTGCIAIAPYKNLVVYTKRQQTLVTWNIIGPAGYHFGPNGIYLVTPPATYKDKGVSGGTNPTKYSWQIDADAAADSAQFRVYIRNPEGVLCDEGDPGITNDPN